MRNIFLKILDVFITAEKEFPDGAQKLLLMAYALFFYELIFMGVITLTR